MYYLISSAALLILSAATIFKQNLKIKDLSQNITTLKVYEEESVKLKQLNIDYKSLLISTYCPKIYVSVDPNYVLHVEFYSIGWENLFDKYLLTQHKEFFDELTETVCNEWKTNILEVYRTGISQGPIKDNLLICLPNTIVKEFNVTYYISKDQLGSDVLIRLNIIDETKLTDSIRISKEKEELARILLQMTTHQIKNKARTLSLVLEELETREEKVRNVNELLDHRKCKQDDDLINKYSKLVQSVIDTSVVSSLKQKTKEILNLTEYIAKLCHQNLVAIDNTIINLNLLVARACRELSLPLEQIKYDLRYCIKGDKNLLTEVFIEILSNSIKYADPNRKLYIEVTAKETIICGEKALLVSIQDNGIGIPTNKLLTVIEPYVRLNKEIEGTGLGLTFVKQILRRHNAELNLVPGVNEGLCVELLFKGGFIKRGLTVMNEKKLRILLLDDEYQEYENWNKWANLLEWNPNIFYASTISEAIDLTNSHKIDIFVVDIFLEKENGIDFLNNIKNTPGIKLALSNTINNIEIKQIAELGAVLFSKQNTQSASLKLLSTIKSMGELGKQPNETFLLNQPDFSIINIKIEKNEREIHNINVKLNNIIEEHIETITTIEEIKSSIIGSYDKKGLKDRLDILEENTEANNNSGLTILLKYLVEESKKSPGLLILILIVLLFSAISLPFMLIKSLID